MMQHRTTFLMIAAVVLFLMVETWMSSTLSIGTIKMEELFLPRQVNNTIGLNNELTQGTQYADYIDLNWHNNISGISQKPSVEADYVDENYPKNWQKIQHHRRQQLQETCNGISNTSMTLEYLLHNQKLLDHLLVDHKYKAIYCYIPKIACTNWKKLWLQMKNIRVKTSMDDMSDVHYKAYKHVLKFRKVESHMFWYVMRTYKKFLIVRHPIERLISAFRNKFEHSYNDPLFQKISKNIMQHYRKWGDVPDKIDSVTFQEFVQFLLDSVTQGKALNEHWKSYESLCHPCTIHYDYIGRYEHLSLDSNRILEELNVSSNIRFPDYQPRNTSNLIQEYLATLHPQQRKELYRIYERDAQLFQYQ